MISKQTPNLNSSKFYIIIFLQNVKKIKKSLAISDESRNLPHPITVMDDQNAIKKAFNARAVMVQQSKGHNNLEAPINTALITRYVTQTNN